MISAAKLNELQTQRLAVITAIEAIKDHRRKNKKLYRDFYVARDLLKESVEEFKDDDSYGIVKVLTEFDTAELFFNSNRVKIARND